VISITFPFSPVPLCVMSADFYYLSTVLNSLAYFNILVTILGSVIGYVFLFFKNNF